MTVIESTFALILSIILFAGLMYFVNTFVDNETQKKERYTALMLENGIKANFSKILDTFEPISSIISSDNSSSMSWGWANPNSINTSPLPVYIGNHQIRYNVDLGSITNSSEKQSLINSISGAFGGVCTLDSTTATTITLTCDSIINNIQYNTASGLVTQYHTPGSTFNYLDTPIVVATFTREYTSGLTDTKTYNISLADVFDKRKTYSIAKLYETSSAMKTFYNQKLALETSNTYPSGLNTIDDAIVPYQWELLGDSNSVSTALCIRDTGSGVCVNLNTNDIWRNSLGASPDALIWRRVIQNALQGQTKYSVDGFNNPLRMLLIANQCGSANLDACSQTPPPVPSDNYAILTTLRAPYSTLIYSRVANGSVNGADTSTSAPTSCRFYFTY